MVAGASGTVEMRVADVRRTVPEGDRPRQYVVLIEEVGGQRRLPIWIGAFEGTAMALQLEHVQVPRPTTFSFTASLLQAAGARLSEVRITRLAEETFYAETEVEGPDGIRSIDARPSDALNLALVTGAPIRVERAVLEAVAAQEKSASPHPRPHQLAGAPGGEGTDGAAEIAAETMASWAGPQARTSQP